MKSSQQIYLFTTLDNIILLGFFAENTLFRLLGLIPISKNYWTITGLVQAIFSLKELQSLLFHRGVGWP